MFASFKLNPRIRWRWEGEDKILLNTMIGMNKTAGQILELCEKMHTLRDVTEEMSKKYPNVPRNKLQSGVERLIQKLLKWNILLPEDCMEPKMSFTTPLYGEHIASYFKSQLSAPVSVSAQITFNCNARCLHCFVSAPQEPVNELSTEEWKQVIDELHELNVFGISFTGGDPLLREDLEELVEYSEKYDINTSIQTNGFKLIDSKIEKLVSAGLRGVYLSLDGLDEETHDFFRCLKGSYHRVIHAIKVLVREKVTLQVNTTLTRLNCHQIPEIIKYLNELGVPRLNLMRLIPIGRTSDNLSLRLTEKEHIELLREIYEKDQELGGIFIVYPELPAAYYERSLGLDGYVELKKKSKIGWCAAAITSCTISPTGDVMPCDVSIGVSLGNVRQTSFKEVWENSPILRALRTLAKRQQKPCSRCKLNEVCIGGCKALSSQVGVGGDLYTADPECVRCFETFKSHLEVS